MIKYSTMINITPSQELTKIYLVTNCYGDPNKVYIGKEKYPKLSNPRKYDHRRTYGKDIIFSYIDEIESLDSKDWKPLECFWINYFKFLGFEVQNKNEGGGGLNKHSDETRMIIKQKNKGVPKPKGFGEKISKAIFGQKRTKEQKQNYSKPRPGSGPQGPRPDWVINKMRVPRSEVSKQNMKSPRPGSGPQGPRPEKHREKMRVPKPNLRKVVYQYNLDGNFIRKWESAIEASSYYNVTSSTIRSACRGKQKTAVGFIWRFNLNDNVSLTKSKKLKPILQYDLEGNFIKEWEGLKEAVLFYKKDQGGLSSCLNGRTKTWCKYLWKFKELDI